MWIDFGDDGQWKENMLFPFSFKEKGGPATRNAVSRLSSAWRAIQDRISYWSHITQCPVLWGRPLPVTHQGWSLKPSPLGLVWVSLAPELPLGWQGCCVCFTDQLFSVLNPVPFLALTFYRFNSKHSPLINMATWNCCRVCFSENPTSDRFLPHGVSRKTLDLKAENDGF